MDVSNEVNFGVRNGGAGNDGVAVVPNGKGKGDKGLDKFCLPASPLDVKGRVVFGRKAAEELELNRTQVDRHSTFEEIGHAEGRLGCDGGSDALGSRGCDERAIRGEKRNVTVAGNGFNDGPQK